VRFRLPQPRSTGCYRPTTIARRSLRACRPSAVRARRRESIPQPATWLTKTVPDSRLRAPNTAACSAHTVRPTNTINTRRSPHPSNMTRLVSGVLISLLVGLEPLGTGKRGLGAPSSEPSADEGCPSRGVWVVDEAWPLVRRLAPILRRVTLVLASANHRSLAWPEVSSVSVSWTGAIATTRDTTCCRNWLWGRWYPWETPTTTSAGHNTRRLSHYPILLAARTQPRPNGPRAGADGPVRRGRSVDSHRGSTFHGLPDIRMRPNLPATFRVKCSRLRRQQPVLAGPQRASPQSEFANVELAIDVREVGT